VVKRNFDFLGPQLGASHKPASALEPTRSRGYAVADRGAIAYFTPLPKSMLANACN
jgi:hypothetical protein